jgi:hypothetical protein
MRHIFPLLKCFAHYPFSWILSMEAKHYQWIKRFKGLKRNDFLFVFCFCFLFFLSVATTPTFFRPSLSWSFFPTFQSSCSVFPQLSNPLKMFVPHPIFMSPQKAPPPLSDLLLLLWVEILSLSVFHNTLCLYIRYM